MRFNKSTPALDRFLSRVYINKDTGCWEWTHAKDHHGYASFYHGKVVKGHRWSYRHYKGDIPEGLVLDHLCSVKHCVNPDHLEPVTNAENIRRERNSRTQCPYGHQYDQENTYWNEKGHRGCITCRRRRSIEWKRKSKNKSV